MLYVSAIWCLQAFITFCELYLQEHRSSKVGFVKVRALVIQRFRVFGPRNHILRKPWFMRNTVQPDFTWLTKRLSRHHYLLSVGIYLQFFFQLLKGHTVMKGIQVSRKMNRKLFLLFFASKFLKSNKIPCIPGVDMRKNTGS